MDAFDSDVLIYAAVGDHPLGRRVLALFADRGDDEPVGIGSLLLIPELLTKPTRRQATAEIEALAALLGRLDLCPVDAVIAELAVALGASYALRAPDALHLATAVAAGADRFITNNTKDFPSTIGEIDITTPAELADPG